VKEREFKKKLRSA